MKWITAILACLSITFEPCFAEPPPGAATDTASGVNAKPKRFASLDEMQTHFYNLFVNTPGFGAGRLLRLPAPLPPFQIVLNSSTYSVSPPQLIGLEDKPVAYIPIRAMPVKDDFTSEQFRKLMRTRPLSAAETNGVSMLRGGTAIAVVTNQSKISTGVPASFSEPLVVLGALRAASACAACHSCEVGTLLGAFTYNLTPLTVQPDLATNSIPNGNRTAAKGNTSPAGISVARRSRL